MRGRGNPLKHTTPGANAGETNKGGVIAMKTKKEYEDYLNEFSQEEIAQCPDYVYISKPGTWLKKNDPIAFEVGYNEWEMEN